MGVHMPTLVCAMQKYDLRHISSTVVYHQSQNYNLPFTHRIPHFNFVYVSSSAVSSFLLSTFVANSTQTSISRQQHFFRI